MRPLGQLTVLEYAGAAPNGNARWRCRCSCDRETIVRDLRAKDTRSCGCLVRETVREQHVTHGHTRDGKLSPEYRSWHAMRLRCYTPKTTTGTTTAVEASRSASDGTALSTFLPTWARSQHPSTQSTVLTLTQDRDGVSIDFRLSCARHHCETSQRGAASWREDFSACSPSPCCM
jgi:hypothetical protein